MGFLQPPLTQYHTRRFHAWSWRSLKWEDMKTWLKSDTSLPYQPQHWQIMRHRSVLNLKEYVNKKEPEALVLTHLYLPSRCSRSLQPASRASHPPPPSRGPWWHDRPAFPLSHAGTHLQHRGKLWAFFPHILTEFAPHFLSWDLNLRGPQMFVLVTIATKSDQPHRSCTAENLHIQRKLPPRARSCTARSWSAPAGTGRCMCDHLKTQRAVGQR